MNRDEIRFLEELRDLLQRYKAEISSNDGDVEVWAYAEYDDSFKVVVEQINISLGSWFNGG